ncbi:uncharacterized protein LOC141594390 [Silene latifolia]|uniref:uncharacterized protein LOC141594390 n=1 Tax=Silene latifolia TaxID=37657 RepID=UPI003D7787AA
MQLPDDYDEYQSSCQSVDPVKIVERSTEIHVTPNLKELKESLGISPSAANKVGQTSKDCVIKPNPIELKEPTNCRLTCVHDGVISNVAEATVYPNEDDTELVHGTPLLVGNVRVSIDKVLEGTAPLPVPTEFLERVADAAGSFVQWPKELIVIGNEESLSIRPSTGKKQKRTSKGCVIKPTSAPNPIELTEPTKCRLTCVHDGVIFNVAEATVYPNEDDTELVHGTPLLVGNVRVSIDKVLEGTAPLPVPTEFLERVADAAESFVQWPKELIVIGDEVRIYQIL